MRKIAHGPRAAASAQRRNRRTPEKIDALAAVLGDLVDLVVHRQRARRLPDAHQVFGEEPANLLPLLQRGAFHLTVQNGGAAPFHVRGFPLADVEAEQRSERRGRLGARVTLLEQRFGVLPGLVVRAKGIEILDNFQLDAIAARGIGKARAPLGEHIDSTPERGHTCQPIGDRIVVLLG